MSLAHFKKKRKERMSTLANPVISLNKFQLTAFKLIAA